MLRKILLSILLFAMAVMLSPASSADMEQKPQKEAEELRTASTTAAAEPESSIPAPVPVTAPAPIQTESPAASAVPSDTAPTATMTAVPAETPVSPLEDSVKISLSFAGDCTLGTDASFLKKTSFPQVLADNGNDFKYFFSGVKQIFQDDDLTLVNLETTLTDATLPAVKKFRFKGDPAYAAILKEGSVEVVNVANNHTMDYLQKGFDDTLAALKKAGVEYSGREHLPVIDVKGVKVAFIGYTIWDDNVRGKLLKSLKQAREEAQLVIVSFHWGVERDYSQNDDQISLAHYAIDNGADAVIGHHPHVLQGVEGYKGRYIAYSLGNFCFGGNSNPADKDSMIFRLEFQMDNGKLSAVRPDIIPCSISSSKNVNDYRPVILEGTEKDRVLAKIKKWHLD